MKRWIFRTLTLAAVTVTGLALVALAVIVTARTHLARWP